MTIIAFLILAVAFAMVVAVLVNKYEIDTINSVFLGLIAIAVLAITQSLLWYANRN